MKFRKETVDTKYGDKMTKWWLDGGTKHLPTIYMLKGGYDWRVYDENDEMIKESLWAKLRTKKDAIEWIQGYDQAIDESIANEARLESERLKENAIIREEEQAYNESFIKDVDVVFDKKVGDFINVQMFSLSKLNSFGDGASFNKRYGRQLKSSSAKIEHIKEVSQSEYDEFVFDFYGCSLSNSFSGGGTAIDNKEIEGYDSYFELPPELREFYNNNCYELVTVVIAKNRKPVVVNPQGFTYIRYAGLVIL